MSNELIRNEYEGFITEYSKYFISNDDKWSSMLSKVKEYIDSYDKKPSIIDKDKDVKILGTWLGTQQKNYKSNKKIMSNESTRNDYKEFIVEYSEYFKKSHH